TTTPCGGRDRKPYDLPVSSLLQLSDPLRTIFSKIDDLIIHRVFLNTYSNPPWRFRTSYPGSKAPQKSFPRLLDLHLRLRPPLPQFHLEGYQLQGSSVP